MDAERSLQETDELTNHLGEDPDSPTTFTRGEINTTSRKPRSWSAGRIGYRLNMISAAIIGIFAALFTLDFTELLPLEWGIDGLAIISSPFAGILGIIGSFFSFRALVRNEPGQPGANGRERVLGRRGLCLFGLNVFVPVAGFSIAIVLARMLTPSSYEPMEDNISATMKMIHDNCWEAATTHPEKCFPSLSRTPGKIRCDTSKFTLPYTERPDRDKRFFYLGYEMRSEREMEAFSRLYKAAYTSGKWLEGDLVCPDVEGGIIPRLNIRPPAPIPDAERPPLPFMRGGDIPVLIENIENNQGKGGHVLFLDGHVAFMEYPGQWPMTEKTIAWLNELDQIGPSTGVK